LLFCSFHDNIRYILLYITNIIVKSSSSLKYSLLLLTFVGHVYAEDTSTAVNDEGGLINNWMSMVAKTKEEQPHWITPLATVTPRLEQELRMDVSKQYMNTGFDYTNYGGGKGLELIPTENTEIIVNAPNYQTRDVRNLTAINSLISKGSYPNTGWQDESLLVKYRFLSANEENGNYIVTGFLGASLPTGDEELTSRNNITTYSNHKEIYTATLAAGKGWGDRESGISIQSTLGMSDIVGNQLKTGTNIPSVQWNTSLQGHVSKYFWPEIELNTTHFEDGLLHGKNQVLVTYGVMLGRFTINEHSNFIIGAGYQNAISSSTSNAYDRGWTMSARITF